MCSERKAFNLPWRKSVLTILLSLAIAASVEPFAAVAGAARLYPSDLVYQGAFRVPRDKPTVNGEFVWYGRGTSESSTMNWDSQHGSILMPGLSGIGNFMGGFIPAAPLISPTKKVADLNTAVMNPNLPFTDLTGGLQGNYNYLASAYFDGQNYLWTLFNTYDVTTGTPPRFGISGAWASDQVTQVSNLSGVQTRNWSRWIVDVDKAWSDQHLQHDAFGLGSSRTNGSFGPSLYFIDKKDVRDPVNSLPNVTGIYYDNQHMVNSFSLADMYADAVWVNHSGKQAYVVLVRNAFRVESPHYYLRGADRWWHTAGLGASVAYKSRDRESTSLAQAITASDTMIALVDATVLTSTGYVRVNEELVHYERIDRATNTLLSCSRGLNVPSTGDRTTAVNHTAGTVVSQQMPDIIWYGVNSGGYDTCMRIPMLHFYDTNEIAEIVRGERESWNIQPYAYMTLDQEFFRSMGAVNGNVGIHDGAVMSPGRSNGGFDLGIAVDPNGNLYIGEKDGDPETYDRWPIIHQYSISGAGAPPPSTPPAAPANAKVDGNGAVSWDPSNRDVLYVIFKWFTEPHYSLPDGEYRPIRTSLAAKWTDPHYQIGDKYKIVAYDRNMSASAPAYTEGQDTPLFVAVTNISGVPTAMTAGTPLALAGTVVPNNATNKAVTWSVANARTTGATLTGNVLNTTAPGTVTARATIVNGTGDGADYTQDFDITVTYSGGGGNPGGGGNSGGRHGSSGGGCSVGFGIMALSLAVCVLLRRRQKEN